MSLKFSGRCLCEQVLFECHAEPVMVGHCHCVDCRRASGSGHCTHIAISRSTFETRGKIKFFNKSADSGNMVSRGFCANCGCAIMSKNSAMPDTVFIRASALDDPDLVCPQMVVYASRAPQWDYMDPELPSFSEMPDGGPEKAIENAG